ncbi:MAG: hypothetical protein M0T83_06550 [Nitrospiraceae bacterium]|nr:hypothetical protein [Nitrospiraceae bacterium]
MSALVTVEEVEQRALTLPEKADHIKIMDADTFKEAAEFTLTLRAIKKEIDNTFDPIVKKAHEAHKEAVSQKKKVMEPVEQAQKVIDRKIGDFHAEEERKRKVEEDRLRKEAEEQARKEEEDRRLQEASRLEQEGNSEMAEALLEAPIAPPVVVLPKVETQAPKVEGLSVSKVYKGEVLSLPQLVQAVAQGRAPIGLIEVNQTALNGMARALKEAFSVPGCRVVVESSVRGRA